MAVSAQYCANSVARNLLRQLSRARRRGPLVTVVVRRAPAVVRVPMGHLSFTQHQRSICKVPTAGGMEKPMWQLAWSLLLLDTPPASTAVIALDDSPEVAAVVAAVAKVRAAAGDRPATQIALKTALTAAMQSPSIPSKKRTVAA